MNDISTEAAAAKAEMAAGHHGAALDLWRAVLVQNNDDIAALIGSGDCLMASGQSDLAADAYERAYHLRPDISAVLFALGTAEASAGRTGQARDHLKQYLEQDDNNPHAHNNLAMVLARLGDREGAEKHYHRALELKPDFVSAHSALEVVRKPMPDWQKVLESGFVDLQQGSFAEACEKFQSVLLSQPQNYRAWESLGVAELGLGQPTKALEAVNEALKIEPRSLGALHHRAISLRALGRSEDAIHACDDLLSVDPGNVYALSVRGAINLETGKIPAAIPDLEAAISSSDIGPSKAALQAALAFARKATCQWGPELDQTIDAIDKNLKAPSGDAALMVISPFQVLPLGLGGQALSEVARRASHKAATSIGVMPAYKKQMRDDLRIRIGYISPDFVNHSVAAAVREVISNHDRSRFVVEGFSLARAHDETSLKFVEAFDELHDVSAMGHARAAAFIAWRNIDILIELAGHTRGGKPEILAYKPAPVQISAVGYGAPVNAGFIPWHIVDRHLVPADARKYYDENLIDMPENALPASAPLSVDQEADRKTCGLPKDGILLGNLGGSYKIDPLSFDAWMQILKAVPEVKLVLLDNTGPVNERLGQQAINRGVAANRLIFVPFVTRALHLARYRHIDLCLDTLNHNGGVTTTDALWLGAPVLTMTREGLPDRMGPSLLHAAGLPDLVAEDLEDFVDRGTRLVSSLRELASLRQRLLTLQSSAPLFDIALYTRNLEAALLDLWAKAVDNPV
jgi:protein O-GlcNAc transferase